MNVSICICTRKRKEGLKRLLKSFDKMLAPANTNIRIIVVENDIAGFSEAIVKEFALKSKFSTSYFLENRQGLANARNRSVKEAKECDFCCFVDDDQIVDSNWLIELLKCQSEFNADGVWGQNPPIFGKEVPSYIRNFHEPQILEYGATVEQGFSNCLMIRKEYLDKIEGPFDIRLNFTGGEDSLLTNQITRLGGNICYNPKAIAYEIITDNRTTINYIIRRSFRIANARQLVNSILKDPDSRNKEVFRLILRLFYGILLAIPYLLFGKTKKLNGVIKIANALGGFAFILGKQSQFYKQNE